MNILQRDHGALVGWNIDACNTGHDLAPCADSLSEPPINFSILSVSSDPCSFGGDRKALTRHPAPASLGARHRAYVLPLNNAVCTDSPGFRQPPAACGTGFCGPIPVGIPALHCLVASGRGLAGLAATGSRGTLGGTGFCRFFSL